MKVLLISQYYPPEIGAASNRIGYFAQHLAQVGHEVSVLTSTPNYPEGKVYSGYTNKYTLKNENGINVYRTKIFLSAKKSMTSRLAHYLSFLVSSFVVKMKIPKPDVVIATSPPLFVGLIGVIFKKLWRVPFILDVRDIWPESAKSVGMVKAGTLVRQAEKLARWIYKNANYITATSPGIKNKILDDSPSKEPEEIHIVPNGAELDLFEARIDGKQIKKAYKLENKFVILYTGNLGLAQYPEVLVQTAEVLKSHKDISFLIVGAGVLAEKLQEEADKKNLTNIIFAGNQPRLKMPHYVAAADVCIIPYRVSDTFRKTFPSKMFDYMGGSRPIIINLKGEASDLMEEAGCGLLAKEQDAEDLAKNILYLKENPSLRLEMGKSGRDFVEKSYRRDVIANKLENAIIKACNR